MLSFDFNTMVDSLVRKEDLEELRKRKDEIYDKFNNSNMIGWTKAIDDDLIEDIYSVSNRVKKNSDCLVVIGIGGSFLGSLAVTEMFTPYFNDSLFPVIYAGTTMSSKYMSELLEYLQTVDFSVNVISKSGTTMETMITYDFIKKLMKKKYSKEEMQKRIIITTDAVSGKLREEVNNNLYTSFMIPEDIGGRYSIMTAAHLFVLSFKVDIRKFVKGYYQGKKYMDDAYNYAVVRNALFRRGKYIENFCIYEEKFYYFTEWLKQLFGESEGKNNKGIFPVSTVHTRDLHSLGQFIQEGNKIVFETFIKVLNSNEVIYNNKNLHEVNNIVLESVRKAHYSGDVACNLITLDEVNEETVGELMYFFMMSAAFSGLLFNINPFDQPGVEVYKKEVRDNLVF